MTVSDFPKLMELIELIGLDNNMPLRPDPPLEKVLDDLYTLEEQAGKLHPIDAATFCAGEQSEAEEIAARLNIQPLHEFLTVCFDGIYRNVFYL